MISTSTKFALLLAPLSLAAPSASAAPSFPLQLLIHYCWSEAQVDPSCPVATLSLESDGTTRVWDATASREGWWTFQRGTLTFGFDDGPEIYMGSRRGACIRGTMSIVTERGVWAACR